MKRRYKTGISRNSGLSLNILTDDERHEIHLSTLELLKDTGAWFQSHERVF
jgi:trimethylamine:corrinoid methyltransferase-like protein